MTHAAAIRYRAAAAALRGIRARAGRTEATTRAIDRHEKIKAAAVADLLDGGHRHLVGLLVEEEHLAERIRSTDRLTPRLELRARINVIRHELKGLL